MDKFFICRFVIESNAPLAIHSGDRDVGRDTQLAKDWNNLPYIPATAIVGVWRSIIENDERFNDLEIKSWFGEASKSNSQASHFIVTDGLLLDQNSCLSYGIIDQAKILNDEVYKLLRNTSSHRERTAINARAVAKAESKFDVSMLPKGARFSFDVQVIFDPQKQSENDLKKLLQLFSDHSFSLGSNASNGFGTFDLKGFDYLYFDLGEIENKYQELVKFRELNSTKLEIKNDFVDFSVDQNSKLDFIDLDLQAIDTWKIGRKEDRDRNDCCYTEPYMRWEKERYLDYDRNEEIVIMGSSIKGIILHRTLYHYLKLKNKFAEDVLPNNDSNFSLDLVKHLGEETIGAFIDLFGYASTHGNNEAYASKLVIKDVIVDCDKDIARTHNKIDVFSGGTMSSALFNEKRLYKPQFTLKIGLTKNYQFKDDDIKEAFKRTLIDLAEGFLPIATGTGRQAAITKCKTNFALPDFLR